MTERKPVEHTFESWVDKQIREATERGEFANLRGAGKPIPGVGTPVDENWWIRDYLRREGAPTDGLLPDSLLLRRDLERLPATVDELDSETEVRAAVSALNRRIAAWIRTPTPPQVPLTLADAEEVVAGWRQRRARRTTGVSGASRPRPESGEGPASRPRRGWVLIRWWRRLFG
ncbi:DUF1992 domain-containing protein [Nocardia farcinica]|uniref:DnaJ family domain-containing protein n=1 Tax=Nocardia farcinica TaxID=37329 RepID=UPI0018935DC8|nr:DUF1992 domain-containing protein [Nocardia farcinica]MBF6358868.1 DUF1992 domain-containing protein [Nocardia farcinica]